MIAKDYYEKWGPQIDASCGFYKISKFTLCGLFERESGASPDPVNAIGDSGLARGIGQMHDVACRTVGFDWSKMFDPNEAIPACAAYLAFCIKSCHGDEKLGLMAYNRGPTTIGVGYAYMVAVLENAQKWAAETSASITATQS